MRGVLGGFVCICVGLSASASAQEISTPTTTALALEPAALATDDTSPPLFGRLPLPRIRPANAPKPPEPNSEEDVCDTLAASARQHRLPIAFFGNLIFQESGLKPRVVSRAGARGIAQFMPKTARLVGLKDPMNPRQALPASAKFLRGLMHRFGNNYGLAAAAYNAGPGRVSRWLKRGGALPRETRNYVVTITGKRADQWRGAHGNGFGHNLTGRIPCANLKAFAELENNPASEHSLRPVRFVLPLPLPNPLRQAQQTALANETANAAEPQLTVNVEMKLPAPRDAGGTQPAEKPTASITVVLPPPQTPPRRDEMAVAALDTARPAPIEQMPSTVAAIKNPPMPRVHPHRPAGEAAPVQVAALGDSDVSMIPAIKHAPTPRAHPHRVVEQDDTPLHVAALSEPGVPTVAAIKHPPLPRANPRRPGDQGDAALAIKNPPLPRPRRTVDDADAGKIDNKLPLPRARPLTIAEAGKKK